MTDRDLLAIHQALLDGHPTAPRDFADAAVPRLYPILKRRHALLPREIVEDAAHDALLAIITDPALYQPERGSLMNLLVRIGEHKLVDSIRRAARRSPEIAAGGLVELEELEANHPPESGLSAMELDGVPREVEALLAEILPDPKDRHAWELVCEGRTSVEEFAAALGLGKLPAEELKAVVKRHRDRIVKKVQRRREEFRRYLL